MGRDGLRVSIGPLRLETPVIACSGTWGYGIELHADASSKGLGAFVTKAITLRPREGNPPPRLFETRAGLLNSIGLENVGIEAFVNEKLRLLPQGHLPVIVNIAGESVEDYVALARILSQETSVSAIELNVSCPNKDDGMLFGTSAERVAELTKAVSSACGEKLLIVKLTPNVTDIAPIALAAADAGAQALSLINTVLGLAIDWKRRRPVFERIVAGLSGPAIKPVALACVWRCHEALQGRIPLIGMGGIQTWQDGLEFILAGAAAIGVGTGHFVDPLCFSKLAEGLATYLSQRGISSVQELVGSAHDR